MTWLLPVYYHPNMVEINKVIFWERDMGEGLWKEESRSISKRSLRQGFGARNWLGGDPRKHHRGDRKEMEVSCQTKPWQFNPLGSSGGWDRVSPPELGLQLGYIYSTSCPSLVEGYWVGLWILWYFLPALKMLLSEGWLLGREVKERPWSGPWGHRAPRP